MNPRFIAASCATMLAALGWTAGAQTIEITSPSIGTVTVRPQTIDKRSAATPARRGARADAGSSGVDLGIRRNANGSLYDALDPRQNPVPAEALRDDVATVGTLSAAGNDGDVSARSGNADRAGARRANQADFPYGVNGAAR